MIYPTYFEVGRRVGLPKRRPLLRLPNLPDVSNLYLSIENVSGPATPTAANLAASRWVGGMDGMGNLVPYKGYSHLTGWAGGAGRLAGAMYT